MVDTIKQTNPLKVFILAGSALLGVVAAAYLVESMTRKPTEG